MKIDDVEPEVSRVLNANHENDATFAVKHARRLLKIVGVWPYFASKPTRIGRCASKFLIPLTFVLVLVLVIPLATNMATRDIPRSQFLMQIGPVCFRLANLLKYSIMLARRDSVRSCMRQMEADWRSLDNEKDRQTMLRNLRTGHGLILIFVTSAYSSAVFYYALLPMLKARALDAFNNDSRKNTIFPGADIYVDVAAGRNFEIIYCTNCLAAFYLFTIVISIGSVAVTLVSHACGQIQIILSRFESIVGSDRRDSDGDGLVDDRMSFIITCHVRVLR